MVFSSPRFIIFLCIVLLVLGFLSQREVKKRLLALASCFFYAAWDWRYLGLLLLVSAINYLCALQIDREKAQDRRRVWLAVSVVSNLATLAYFKYCNFFIDNFNSLFGWTGRQFTGLDILLPVGISFYTFKTMSYTIDVYRRDIPPCHSWLDYATFSTFFPELIAGPIVRGSVFLPQMVRDIGPTRDRLISGGSLFLQGLLKKLLIADRMALIADPIFARPENYAPITIWFGAIAYAIQIFCDFAGYSDMAIGCARMIGYDLPENFRMPYVSTNITEFWRRWHMTLSSWLRDYLYVPLGGNRLGRWRMYINLTITMLLGGLWHGASWNFVVWGGLHGAALAVHKAWTKWPGSKAAIPTLMAWAMTICFVFFAWVPFRASGFDATLLIWRKMLFLGDMRGGLWFPTWLGVLGLVVVVAHLFGLWMERAQADEGWKLRLDRLLSPMGLKMVELSISGLYLVPYRLTVMGSYCVTIALWLLFYFAPMDTSPFIYFQF